MILGIDPGLRGALAVLDDDGKILWLEDMPAIPSPFKGKTRNILNLPELATYFRMAANLYGAETAVIERVGPMPKQGITSTFRFGETVGAVQALAAANELSLVLVRPQEWKKHFKLSAAKDVARGCATRLWPSKSNQFAKVKDTGKAEAALMAEWHRQTR